MRVEVVAAATLEVDPELLTDLERTALAAIEGARRRAEWVRGRVAIKRVLGEPGTSIVVDPDGAPRVVGDCAVSLSHDGDWIAVAVARGDVRVGVDLCLREHGSRCAKILAWLGVASAVDPVVTWAALEVVLKLRRWSVEALRDRALAVDLVGDRVVVCGLGGDVSVETRSAPAYALAWGESA